MPDNPDNGTHLSSERAKDRFVSSWRFGGIVAGTIAGVLVGMLMVERLPDYLELVAWLIGWLTWVFVFMIFYSLGEWRYKQHQDRAP